MSGIDPNSRIAQETRLLLAQFWVAVAVVVAALVVLALAATPVILNWLEGAPTW